MTIRDLEYAMIVAEEKSISKAAVRLFVAQPALSQCLQKLERELGTHLFIRSNQGVEPTEEGKCFLEFSKTTLREYDDLQKKILDLKHDEHGTVRLGLTGTQATYVLPYFLPAFKEKFPKINIVLVEGHSNDIEQKILAGECEVGILHPPIMAAGLSSFELSHDEMVVIPRRGSRYHQHIFYKDGDDTPYIHMEFLGNEPLILTSSNQRSRLICDQIFAKAGIIPVVKQITNHLSTLDALGQVDYATVILPWKQVSEPLKRKGCFRIDPEFSVPYTFHVAVAADRYLSKPAERLFHFLEERKGTF